VLFIVSLVSSIYGLFQYIGIDFGSFVNYFGSRLSQGTRLFTIFGNPNLLGGFNVFILPLITAFFIKAIKDKNIKKVWYLGLVGIFAFITLILSQTRGCWIASGISLVVFFFLYYRKEGVAFVRKNVVLSIIIIFILVGALVGLGKVVLGNNELSDTTSANIRLLYYGNTLKMIKENPVFGRGVGTFSAYYPLYRNKQEAFSLGETAMEYRVEHPHNEHLELLSELGIIGYLLFLWIVVEALILLLKRDDIISLGIAISIFGLLVDGLMMQNLRFTVIASLLWLSFGFSTIVKNKNEKKSLGTKIPLKKLILSIFIILIMIFPIVSAYKTMHSGYYIKMGLGYYSSARHEEAVSWFSKALEINPDNKRALYYMAASSNAIGKKGDAINYYQKLLEIDPNFIQANFKLGLVFLERNDIDEAEKYFLKQIEVNNMYWQSYYYLAYIEDIRGNNEKAKEYFIEIDRINEAGGMVDKQYLDQVEALRDKIGA